jgi:hypothetical protein
MNRHAGVMQVNLPHTWDIFEDVDKDYDNQSDRESSRDKVCNVERRKLSKVCERNMLVMRNGK